METEGVDCVEEATMAFAGRTVVGDNDLVWGHPLEEDAHQAVGDSVPPSVPDWDD